MDKYALECGVLVFAKAPMPGQVKTRMQPHLSKHQSANLHRKLVEHCLNECKSVGWSSWELWTGSQHDWWSLLRKKYPVAVYQQFGDGLGERMFNAFEESFDRKAAKNLILVGTDCPFIASDYLYRAASMLKSYDVVLGPAYDGGYVMIGLSQECRKKHHALFENVDWSTDKVVAQTRQRLVEQELSCYEMETLSDIDRPEDLQLLTSDFPGLVENISD